MTDLLWTNCTVKLGDLKPWAHNPRLSTKAQAKRIIKSFDKFGQVQTVSIGPGNEVYDGHQRLSALLTVEGADYVIDARRSNRALTEDERKELVVTLHVGAVGSWDWQAVSGWEADKLQAWGMDSDALKMLNNDANNLKELLAAEDKESLDAEPEIDRAEELRKKWNVESGQLWQLGDHRLICGDCTDVAVVERVMGGERADCVFTSPPYNQGNSSGDLFSHGKRVENLYKHGEDNKTDEEYKEFLFRVLNLCAGIVSKLHSCVWNVAYNAKSRDLYGKIIFSERNPFNVFESIVWNKGGSINLPQVGIYSRMCEFVFVMAIGDRYLTSQEYGNPRWNYWETKRANQLREHHATFPLEFAERGISELSINNCIVYEPFSGSGTTLIACENLGRRCRAVEISPAYVAVALERWHVATGKMPELIG